MAQGQMKHLADQNGCLDGVIGIRLGSAALSCFCWSPLIDRRLRKPDREVAALGQGIVVLGPVGHLVFWLGELVAAVLAVFVGHLLFLSMKSIRIMPFRQNGGRLSIYATTPITVCDTRLGTMRYGRDILAGLPPFPVVRQSTS